MVDTAASTPTGTAGADDAFSKAFNAAVESTSLDEAAYVEEAIPPEGGDERPVETENVEKPAAEAKPAGKVTPKADKAPAEKPVAPATSDAPANWDAKRKAAFDALPPEARPLVLEMAKGFEADFTRRSTELAEDRKFAQGVRSLISDTHRAQMRNAGMSEADGIGFLIKLNDFATRDPAAYVRWVVEQTGLNPQQLFQSATGMAPQPGQQPQPQADPISPLYEMVQSLKGEVDGFKHSQADRAIQRFRSETGEDGQPRRPHFAQVEQAMAELLVTPKYRGIEDYGERLQAAYDAAVYMDPAIRTQIVESEADKRVKAATAQAELAKARRAQPVVKSAPTAAPRAKAMTLEEATSAALAQLGNS